MIKLKELLNEAAGKLSISQLPLDFIFKYPIGGTSKPGNFEDWYRDGMKLKKGRIEKFSPEDDKKLRSAIQEVSRKSMGTLINWKKSNPDYANINSEFSQQCITMQRNSVAGDDRETFFPKVIRALNKEMVVDKNL